jgi:dTDP-4-amino-4,6-dideoxygalactose transaminase
MKVRLLDLQAQYAMVGTAVENAVRRVLVSGAYILGEDVRALEQELAERAGVKRAVGVSSGSDALIVALQALGVGPGDEVVTTTFSFFATAGAIARVGARPVFADIDEASFNIDERDAAKRITSRTKALIVVHLFGRPAGVEHLRAAGLPIIEDAAQALDAAGVGKLGALATLSFFPSKNLGAAGDAGMVLTDDEALADRVSLLRTHGSKPKYVHAVVGGNFRLDTLQAAILRAKLPFLEQWNRQRREHARLYRTLLEGSPVALPEDSPGHVWHHFVIRAPRRDELRRFLAESEVETEVYYPLPLHLQPCFGDLGHRAGDLPRAERAAAEVLALPIHPQLTAHQIEHVAARLREFYQR